MADTLRGSRGLQDNARGSWDLPEAASNHHETVLKDLGTFRALSEGPGTFREQRQTSENDSAMIEIMKIVKNGLIWLGLG